MHVETGAGERVDARNNPDGGNRDLPPPESADPVVGDSLHRGEDGIEVQHRLAHAHEDEGAQAASGGGGLAAERDELLGHLAGGEVAFETRARGRAEIAAHRASDLRGHATGGALRIKIRHEHAFHGASVGEPQQQLHGAVAGDVTPREGYGAAGEFGGEVFAQSGGWSARPGVVRRQLPAGVMRPQQGSRVGGLETIGDEPSLELREGDVAER